MSIGISLAERGFLPDRLTRAGIRQLLEQRLREEDAGEEAANQARLNAFVDGLRSGPVAIEQDAANKQHYEVPTDFYRLALGQHLKYSSCWWNERTTSLNQAEADMLALYCERAQLTNGMRILDVGCGWGSLTLYLAKNYPRSSIHAVSNSATQRAYILNECEQRGLTNVTIDTADLAGYDAPGPFDRIMSVECLEHMRNYGELFARFRRWLSDDGMAFIHVFCHREFAYPFETEGDDNWMGRHFFTGGLMPSFNLFRHFDDDLKVTEQWAVNGTHYGRTARAWLENIDRVRSEIIALFTKDLGPTEAKRMFHRWRMFFMACEELFNYRGGDEWFVGHYLLEPSRLERTA